MTKNSIVTGLALSLVLGLGALTALAAGPATVNLR